MNTSITRSIFAPTAGSMKAGSRRRGASLIDVATGSMLMAVLLIPSIHLVGESQASQRRLHLRDIMIYEADQLIDSTRVALSDTAPFDAAYAAPSDVTSTINVSDAPDLKSRVRIAADASLPTARLLTIVVDVWRDTDGDSQRDADELGVDLRTQWARP